MSKQPTMNETELMNSLVKTKVKELYRHLNKNRIQIAGAMAGAKFVDMEKQNKREWKMVLYFSPNLDLEKNIINDNSKMLRRRLTRMFRRDPRMENELMVIDVEARQVPK